MSCLNYTSDARWTGNPGGGYYGGGGGGGGYGGGTTRTRSGRSFDAYERLAARGEPGAVATEIIDQALDEEMGAS